MFRIDSTMKIAAVKKVMMKVHMKRALTQLKRPGLMTTSSIEEKAIRRSGCLSVSISRCDLPPGPPAKLRCIISLIFSGFSSLASPPWSAIVLAANTKPALLAGLGLGPLRFRVPALARRRLWQRLVTWPANLPTSPHLQPAGGPGLSQNGYSVQRLRLSGCRLFRICPQKLSGDLYIHRPIIFVKRRVGGRAASLLSGRYPIGAHGCVKSHRHSMTTERLMNSEFTIGASRKSLGHHAFGIGPCSLHTFPTHSEPRRKTLLNA